MVVFHELNVVIIFFLKDIVNIEGYEKVEKRELWEDFQ